MSKRNKKTKYPIPGQTEVQALVDAITAEMPYLNLIVDGATWERADHDPCVGTLTLRMFCPRCGVRGPVILSILMDDPKKLPRFEKLAKTAAKEIGTWYERAHHVLADAQRALAGPQKPAGPAKPGPTPAPLKAVPDVKKENKPKKN